MRGIGVTSYTNDVSLTTLLVEAYKDRISYAVVVVVLELVVVVVVVHERVSSPNS
jgi:hypothetical protein